MKSIISFVLGSIITLLCNYVQAQTYGPVASAVWITNCNQSNYYNTSGSGAQLIGPSGNVFDGVDLGVYTQNSGSLILRGAQVKTFKDPAVSNVCGVRLYYRVYLQSSTPGAFNNIDLPLSESCGAGAYPSGGACSVGDQKWQRVIADGETTPYTPVDLTNLAAGNYVLEVYYEATGSFSSTALCDDISTLNNGGANYKATFTIQRPELLISTNPTTCNGSEGSITFYGMASNTSYQVSYTDDGASKGPVTLVSNAAGQLAIPGLNAGLYTNFIFVANGCTTTVYTGVILSNPIFVPAFNAIAPICEGSPAPSLPAVSTNGINGTWSPALINNQATGTYTFTPANGTCALPVTMTVTVVPKKVPAFPFGTSLVICQSGSVPVLPNLSTNGITGTWSPAVVDPNNSGTYVFTPTSTGCVTGTTFTVTVNPVITPNFSFGASSTICAGEPVPVLPNTSTNGISGTWSPAVVDNANSGTYTFTPSSNPCAVPVTYTVTVNPIIPPVFSFGNSLTICSGEPVPALPATSVNGITGTWSPAVVNNTSSGAYTFTPTSDPCAPPTTFTVTVNQVNTPTFSFGTSTSLCAGQPAPVLPNTSTNGITGTWSPAIVDNTTSGSYTFTPSSDPCAPPVTLNVTVNPVTVPVFSSIGSSLTICSGGTVPALPATSDNGIAGTWTPAVVSNTASGTYTFTSAADPCAPPVTYTVTVNPVVTPEFAFGTSQSVCINSVAPVLPTVSTNGITGTWSPAVVDNQVSGTYTFTPAPNQCANPFTFTYEVNPIPSITSIAKDTTVYDGAILPPYNFILDVAGSGVNWINTNPTIGLPASGSNVVPSFKAVNITNDPLTAIVNATPFVNGCKGTMQSYKITVLPLDKDIFVPNVFSPNGDGKNDLLYVYGNYIASVELHIFNQWGERIITLNSLKQGWDGKYKGSPQPVGVYMYVLKAALTDGTKITRKGSITLVR